MEQKKKPYVKPMMVFVDNRTGELSGSPEMIAQILEERGVDTGLAAAAPLSESCRHLCAALKLHFINYTIVIYPCQGAKREKTTFHCKLLY